MATGENVTTGDNQKQSDQFTELMMHYLKSIHLKNNNKRNSRKSLYNEKYE